MPWSIKKAEQNGDEISVTLERVIPGEKSRTEQRVVRHYRTSFNGKPQTIEAWQANVRREIQAFILALDAKEASPVVPQDVTAAVR